MTYLRKIKAGLVKDNFASFVGEEGNIFFEVVTGELRISDGVTPGGLPLAGGGTGGYILPPATTAILGGVKAGSNIIIAPDGTISTSAPFSGSYNDLTDLPVLETDMAYAKRIDFVSDDLLYRGESLPGTPTSASGWRIARLTIYADSDVVEEWASGTADFDKVWDNRLSLSYS